MTKNKSVTSTQLKQQIYTLSENEETCEQQVWTRRCDFIAFFLQGMEGQVCYLVLLQSTFRHV